MPTPPDPASDPARILHSAAQRPAGPILAIACKALFAPEAAPTTRPDVHHLDLSDLTRAHLADLAPSLVLLPLFMPDLDVTQAIETLEKLGYHGPIRVIAPKLPNPRLVEAELRNLGPGPRLTLISTSEI